MYENLFFLFFTAPWRLREPVQSAPITRLRGGRRGGRGGPVQSARSRIRSNGESLAAPIAVLGQAWPGAVVPRACCTATARRPRQRRAHPLAALRRLARGDSGGALRCAGSCAPPRASFGLAFFNRGFLLVAPARCWVHSGEGSTAVDASHG